MLDYRKDRTKFYFIIIQLDGKGITIEKALRPEILYRRPCTSNGQSCCADFRTMISIKAFFLAAYQSWFLIFVSVYRRSVF